MPGVSSDFLFRNFDTSCVEVADLKQENRALIFRLGFSGSNLNVTTF